MQVRYLLDTNIASYVITGKVPHVREHLRRVEMWDVGISAVTEAELRFGAARKTEAARLQIIEEFLLRVEILPWDSAAAKQYAILRNSLEESGTPMGNLDMMIAAQAVSIGATLVTHDRVFQRVKHLKIEDWTKPL
ncbi:MAG TPA: type II toxin-antitoxin system VapC family toxin [Candidatus Sulfotelmatobacter sp.]|nr:type II toxin-antitoxin system VapC family toxin [Candidatus Sulfotelmatobacter sp.]